MSSTQQFVAVIAALHGNDPAQQQQANSWLTSFAETDAAWSAGVEVMTLDVSSDVLFFSANMLLTKTRNHWKKLPEMTKGQVLQVLRSKIFTLASTPQTPSFLLSRVCMAQSAMTCLSGPEAVQELCDQTVTWAQSGMASSQPAIIAAALQLLETLADEANNSDRSVRAAVTPVMLTHTLPVLSLATSVLRNAPPGPKTLAFKCLASWMRLSPDPSASCLLSPGQLVATAPELLDAIVAALAEERCRTEALELLELMLESSLKEAAPQEDVAACRRIMQVFLTWQPALQSSEGDGGLAVAVARVVAAMTNRDPTVFAGDAALGAPAAALMRLVIRRREIESAETALEFFFALNTIPVPSRPAALGPPLFLETMTDLLPVVSFPDAFTSWSDSDVDEDAFVRFREQGALDYMDIVYGLAGTSYLQAVMGLLGGARGWQQLEAALFCLHAVATSTKHFLLNARPSQVQGRESEQADTNQLMLMIFNTLTAAGAPHVSHPHVRATACTLIGDWATWFSHEARAPLLPALAFCLAGIADRASMVAACTGFRNLAARNAARLKEGPVLDDVVKTCVAALAQSHIRQGNKAQHGNEQLTAAQCAAAEGAARIIAELDPAEQERRALALSAPMLAALQTAAATGDSPVVAHNVVLLTSVVRFLEGRLPVGAAAAPRADPVVQVMAVVWPLLSTVASHNALVSNEPVGRAVCELLDRSVHAATSSRDALLENNLNLLLNMFERTGGAFCLEAVASISTAFDQSCAPRTLEALHSALLRVLTMLQQSAASPAGAAAFPGGSGALAEALGGALAFASRFALFQPKCFFDGPAPVGALQLAMLALDLRERAPVQGALLFLTNLLVRSPVKQEALQSMGVSTAAVQQAVQSHCHVIVRRLLVAACTTCPPDSLRKLGALLHALATSAPYAEQTLTAMRSVLLDGFEPLQTTPLSLEDCQRFCAIMVNPALTQPRFASLVSDFAGIAHGTASSEDLLAYEMQ